MLFAVGNNHGGTYYPAIEKALSIIVGVAFNSSSEVARNCGLNVLIDLYASFEPELGAYNGITFEKLESKVKAEIENVQQPLITIKSTNSGSERNRLLAKELLECINDNK